MEFGIQFFPDVTPDQKPADEYFDESLRLVELCDRYNFTHVRTVEHYLVSYGGHSPNPLPFLAACAARTRHARLITGAVLPVFNNPLKLAGEAAMLDAISGGRLELGFARAFLPHEFQRFRIPLDESVARFDEGRRSARDAGVPHGVPRGPRRGARDRAAQLRALHDIAGEFGVGLARRRAVQGLCQLRQDHRQAQARDVRHAARRRRRLGRHAGRIGRAPGPGERSR